MNMEKLRELLLSFLGVTEEEPFGPEVVVYKAMGKMFALVDYDSVPPKMNLTYLEALGVRAFLMSSLRSLPCPAVVIR